MVLIWQALIDLLETILNFFYQFVGDYGIAIILLTVVVRAVLLPLTLKQTKSMHELQKVQPKLKEVQAKYKDDKEKLHKELMKLYSEHKINPFGGCLPLLLQSPIFIALFQMLSKQEALKSPTILGLSDLSKTAGSFKLGADLGLALPYYVLIILMAVSSYIPTKMMTADPQQSRMMLFMEAFLIFVAWQLPAGILVYWTTFNLLTIAQQYVTMRTKREVGKQKQNGAHAKS